MGREVWGTFSVKDHCGPHAFVADVMLYDRLVLPVPPDDDEWRRWVQEGWDPDRQKRLLTILGDRAYPVKWDSYRREQWKSRFKAGSDVAQATSGQAFQYTRTELTAGLPRNITGVEAITTYASIDELEKDLRVKAVDNPVVLPSGAVTAVLGREFLVPDDARLTDDELLREAVAISSDSTFRRKRANYWRWQRDFSEHYVITDQEAIKDAVDEMRELLEEEQAEVRKAGIKMGIRCAFLVSSVTLGMLGGPLTALSLGTAFLAVGQFTVEQLLEKSGEEETSPAALFHDARRHFGWK